MHATIVVAILSAAPATKAGLLLRPLSAFLALRIPPASSGRREACSLLTRSAAAGIACCTASRIFSPLPSVAEPPPIFPVLAAQSELSWVSNKDDVDTFVVMVEMGLPSTGRLCTPPIIQFNLFKTIEASLPEEKAGPFMDAAIEYIEFTRDANDLVDLARGARRQGAPLQVVSDYVTRAVDAAVGAKKALDVMVPILKKV